MSPTPEAPVSTTILTSTVLTAPPEGAANVFVTTNTFPYCYDCVAVSTVTNTVDLRQPCATWLQLSSDGGSTFTNVRREACIQAAGTSFQPFVLREYARLGAWTSWRLVIGGMRGGNVTVSAVADGVCLAAGGYLTPAFTSFGVTGVSSPVEVGATISGSQAFTWATSNPTNVQPNSISITDTTASVVLGSGLPNSGTATEAVGTITSAVPATQTWTVGGINTQSATFNRAYSVNWLWRVYAGSSANATLTANQIKALSDSDALQASYPATYSITNASNVYYFLSYPDSMGSVSNFVDANTGFPISMATSADNAAYSNTANGWSYDLVSVTNVNSVSTNYRLYRTQYAFSAQPLLMKVT
jgi:hypothetical protein